ncbi:MAG: hypothetical protein R2853_09260 [Thermomicrobiales bacterium]
MCSSQGRQRWGERPSHRAGAVWNARRRLLRMVGVGQGGSGAWRHATASYEFRLDHDERERFVDHWQPGPGFRGPEHPHLHVSAAPQARSNAVTTRAHDLDKRRLATGHVSLAMVVRMVIEEFGIAPLRPAWPQILDRAGHGAE